MNIKENFEQLLKQAQSMQDEMQKAQQSLLDLEVTGESGGGVVKLTMNGRHDVTKIQFDNTLFVEPDKEMIEDLTMAAINDAVRKIEKASQDKVAELSKNITVPTDFASWLNK